MLKKILAMLLCTMILLSTFTAFAENTGPDRYVITVTEDGGTYDFDFIEVKFKKDYLSEDFEAMTFEVQIYAENGVPYIEFTPDVEKFIKKVQIKVKKGDVTLYDIATGEYVQIKLDTYNFKVEHFSRYIVID